jgi:C1A family cysteine protease
MKAVALLVVAVVAVSAFTEVEYQGMFTRWIAEHSKTYTHEQFFHRYNTFKANVDFITASNNQNKSYTLAINKFADLNTEEFGAQMCGFRPSLKTVATPQEELAAPVSNDIDWVAAGAVTPVKDQGQCGSCWAFSATGTLEGAVAIKTKQVPNVAEQQLVDCAGQFGNQGCNGGLMTTALDYVLSLSTKGISGTKDYPYTARDGRCKNPLPAVAATISGHKEVASGENDQLMAALTIGPVAVAIEADQTCFQFYHSGILDDRSCGTALDHGVLLVGAGSEGGKDYWRIKNSWGASWGDNGFIRFIRNKNQCGINTASAGGYNTYAVA